MEQTNMERTVFCDFDNPDVSHLATSLADGATNKKKITAAVFEHVRDNIRFGFDLVQVKASETLAKGYGVCWNKALLLAALLRCNHIPARMACNPVNREFMRPAMGDACLTLPETINHCYVQAQLDGAWISVDATLDKSTYAKLFEPCQVTWDIEWNGSNDMQLYTENITGPMKPIDDIDAAIEQDIGNVMPPPAEAAAFFGPINQMMWQAVAE